MLARLALLALSTVAVAAGESPEVRAARTYAVGLDAPLLELRRGAMLVETCTHRLKRACTKEQRKLAAKSQSLVLLDALTLFPQRPTEDPAANITKARDLEQKIAETSATMLRLAYEYDRLVFARYGATLKVCPDGDPAYFRAPTDELIRLEYAGMQELSGDALNAALAALAGEEARIVDELRLVPPADCAAQRNLGEYLMQVLYPKLQPWRDLDPPPTNTEPKIVFGPQPKKPEPVVPEPGVAQAMAGNFITVVATELHLNVFPESAPRIKAIADAVGKANAVQ